MRQIPGRVIAAVTTLAVAFFGVYMGYVLLAEGVADWWVAAGVGCVSGWWVAVLRRARRGPDW